MRTNGQEVGILPGNLGNGFPRNPWSQAKYLLEITLFLFNLRHNTRKNPKTTYWFLVEGNHAPRNEIIYFQTIKNCFLSTDMIFLHRKLFLFKGTYFLSKNIIFCQRKLFPVKRKDFLWKEIIWSEEIISLQKKGMLNQYFVGTEIPTHGWG